MFLQFKVLKSKVLHSEVLPLIDIQNQDQDNQDQDNQDQDFQCDFSPPFIPFRSHAKEWGAISKLAPPPLHPK